MGLGISFGAPHKAGLGLFKKRSALSFNEIADAAEKIVKNSGTELFFSASEEGGTLYLQLYPQAEAVEIFEQEGHTIVWAKTSTAGPGYHVFLIVFLEQLAQDCGLQWNTDDEAREFSDEGGFLPKRSVSAVQMNFANWLKFVAGEVLKMAADEGSGFKLSLPIHLDVQIEDEVFAISPTGRWNRAYFEKLVASSGTELIDLAKGFFPWWTPDLGAPFWRDTAQTLLWTNVPWHPPVDSTERATMELPLLCFDKAKAQSPELSYPEAEIVELREMLTSDVGQPPLPAIGRIGFMRGPMRYPLTGDWSFVVPGYFYREWQDDGEVANFWHGDRRIWASSLVFTKTKDAPPQSSDGSNRSDDNKSPPDSSPSRIGIRTIDLAKAEMTGKAELWKCMDDPVEYWQIQASWEHRQGEQADVCVLTIEFDDELNVDWAMEVVRSVDLNLPEEEV